MSVCWGRQNVSICQKIADNDNQNLKKEMIESIFARNFFYFRFEKSTNLQFVSPCKQSEYKVRKFHWEEKHHHPFFGTWGWAKWTMTQMRGDLASIQSSIVIGPAQRVLNCHNTLPATAKGLLSNLFPTLQTFSPIKEKKRFLNFERIENITGSFKR